MKKTAIILLVALFSLGLFLSSCRSVKPPCPAYSSVENTVEAEILE